MSQVKQPYNLPTITPVASLRKVRDPIQPSGLPEQTKVTIENKTFSACVAAQVPPIAFPGVQLPQPPFNNPTLIAHFDEFWIMIGPTVAGQLIDSFLFGLRIRQELNGKIILPNIGNLPQRWPETDPSNSWIHPTTMWVQVAPLDGLDARHGDAYIQELFNMHAAAVTLTIAYKGHYIKVVG